MKTSIILLSLSLFFTISCIKYTETGPFNYSANIISKTHEDARTDVIYHYGYYVINGKFCWHLDPEDIPEKYITQYIFFNDTLSVNDPIIYIKSTDTLFIQYNKIYADSMFKRTRIVNIDYKPIQ